MERRTSKYKTLQELVSKAIRGQKTRKESKLAPTRRRAQAPQIVTQPIGRQAVATNFMSTKFGSAAPHDDFPEGGLRLVGEMPNLQDDALGASGNAAGQTGVFGPTYSNSGAVAAATVLGVSPTAMVTATTNPAPLSIFGSNATQGNVGAIAQYFRFFRFRRLWLVYEGEASANTTGTVQFSYDRSLPSMLSNLSTSSTQIKGATSVVTRFPWFTTQGLVKLIEDMQSNRADKLWGITQAATQIASTKSNADLEYYFQGAVAGMMDSSYTVLTILGRYRWRFVLDLYGFSSQTADNAVTLENRRLEGLRFDLSALGLTSPSRLPLTLDAKEDSKGDAREDARETELVSLKKKLAEAEKALKNSVLIVDSHIPAGVTPAKPRTS